MRVLALALVLLASAPAPASMPGQGAARATWPRGCAPPRWATGSRTSSTAAGPASTTGGSRWWERRRTSSAATRSGSRWRWAPIRPCGRRCSQIRMLIARGRWGGLRCDGVTRLIVAIGFDKPQEYSQEALDWALTKHPSSRAPAAPLRLSRLGEPPVVRTGKETRLMTPAGTVSAVPVEVMYRSTVVKRTWMSREIPHPPAGEDGDPPHRPLHGGRRVRGECQVPDAAARPQDTAVKMEMSMKGIPPAAVGGAEPMNDLEPDPQLAAAVDAARRWSSTR